MKRSWFLIDRAWVERRDAALRAEEDAAIVAARDAAIGEERAFMDRLVEERARNARGDGAPS